MSEFIPIEKDGETIHVHPDALADHKRLGWREVEPGVSIATPAAVAADGAAKPETAAQKRAREKAERAVAAAADGGSEDVSEAVGD